MASPEHPTPHAAPGGSPGLDGLLPLHPPTLVGRERELRTALQVLRAAAGPSGVMIVGAPGVGKTRLGEETAARMSCSASSADRDAGASGGGRPGAVRSVQRLIPAQVADTVPRLLRSGSARPRLLWIDDAHLLAGPDAECLRELTRRSTHKVLLAMDGTEAHPRLQALWKDQCVVRLEVGPLDVLSTRRLTSALFEDRLAWPGVVRLAAMSQGNPTLLRELARAALARNLVTSQGGTWRLGDAVPVSNALRDLVARPLADLTRQDRRILELIALAEPVRLDVLERIVPADTLLALEDAGAVRVAQPRADAVPGSERSVTLAHPYVAQVLRQDVGPLRRRHCLRIWTRKVPESLLSPAERVRLAQWHLDAGELPEQEPLREAVRCALRVHDVPAAIRLSAAAWYGHSAAWAAELHARALFADGTFDDLHTFAEKVAAGHPEHARALAPVQARAFLFEGRQDQAEETAQQLTGTERSAYLALAAAFRGRFSAALDHARAVLRDPASPCHAESALIATGALTRSGRPHDALRLYEDLRGRTSDDEVCFFEADAVEEAHALALLYAGRLDEAEGILAREYRVALESNLVGVDARRGIGLGLVLLERGRIREALPYFSSTPVCQAAWRPWTIRAAVHAIIAAHCLPRDGSPSVTGPPGGRSDTASVPAGGQLDMASGIPDGLARGPYAAELAVARAWQAHRTGEQEQARAVLHTAVDAALESGTYGDAVVLLHETARLGLPAHPAVGEELPVQGDYLTSRLHFARAVHTGDAELLARVCRTLADAGAHLYAAEGHAELARLQRRSGRGRAATASTVRARALLRDCGEVSTPALHFLGDPAQLSERERTVARLAAQGLTDKEIAQRLVVSPRTVSNTLYRVYQKVGATDRRHLRRLLSP
ncbi:helix-turn-helix transcriptional regulator [Streptomyces griseorubiginosus]|uniref:helix-turn-helix transcriptional regulator n=1 Tax=Streptomyces griseorubiginosus TaxID=67304 RepID=UPI002E7FCD49|nr:LuxR C-terminal-related transcriptional regulator [Streptomyces griseorubiginosus]